MLKFMQYVMFSVVKSNISSKLKHFADSIRRTGCCNVRTPRLQQLTSEQQLLTAESTSVTTAYSRCTQTHCRHQVTRNRALGNIWNISQSSVYSIIILTTTLHLFIYFIYLFNFIYNGKLHLMQPTPKLMTCNQTQSKIRWFMSINSTCHYDYCQIQCTLNALVQKSTIHKDQIAVKTSISLK